MSSVIILKKDLEKLGKKLMKEFYLKIYNEDYLKENEEYKKFYDENLVNEFLSFNKNKNITKYFIFRNEEYIDILKLEPKILLKKIEEIYLNEDLDVSIIYEFFYKMKKKVKIDKHIEFEIDEDFYCMKKSFLKLYNVFYNYYIDLDIIH